MPDEPQPAGPQQPAQPQYAPPQYAAPPQQPGQLYVPGHPNPYARTLPSGRKFWALGFLFFIPYAGWIVAPIVLLVQNAQVRRDPSPIVRENARWAVNWVLTVVLVGFIGLCGLITAAIAGQVSIDAGGRGDILMPLVVMSAVLMVLVQLAHLVVSIIGSVSADRRVFDPVAVIRFVRPVEPSQL